MSFFLSCCEGKEPRDRVLSSDKGKVWKKQHTSLFRRAVARARPPSEFVFHGLRHTYASDLVKEGVPLDVVAKRLGHASSITVSNTYGHLAEHFREEQVRTLFTPLDPHQRSEASRRRQELSKLLKKFKARESREYGHLELASSQPKKIYAQTHKSVLEIFGSAEKG